MSDQGFLISASARFVIPFCRKSKMPGEGFGLSWELATKSKKPCQEPRLGNRLAGFDTRCLMADRRRRSTRVHRRSMGGSPPLAIPQLAHQPDRSATKQPRLPEKGGFR